MAPKTYMEQHDGAAQIAVKGALQQARDSGNTHVQIDHAPNPPSDRKTFRNTSVMVPVDQVHDYLQTVTDSHVRISAPSSGQGGNSQWSTVSLALPKRSSHDPSHPLGGRTFTEAHVKNTGQGLQYSARSGMRQADPSTTYNDEVMARRSYPEVEGMSPRELRAWRNDESVAVERTPDWLQDNARSTLTNHFEIERQKKEEGLRTYLQKSGKPIPEAPDADEHDSPLKPWHYQDKRGVRKNRSLQGNELSETLQTINPRAAGEIKTIATKRAKEKDQVLKGLAQREGARDRLANPERLPEHVTDAAAEYSFHPESARAYATAQLAKGISEGGRSGMYSLLEAEKASKFRITQDDLKIPEMPSSVTLPGGGTMPVMKLPGIEKIRDPKAEAEGRIAYLMSQNPVYREALIAARQGGAEGVEATLRQQARGAGVKGIVTKGSRTTDLEGIRSRAQQSAADQYEAAGSPMKGIRVDEGTLQNSPMVPEKGRADITQAVERTRADILDYLHGQRTQGAGAGAARQFVDEAHQTRAGRSSAMFPGTDYQGEALARNHYDKI